MKRVAVCLCTYKRNGPLERLLRRLVEIRDATPDVQLALVVADDNPNGEARAVVDSFADAFPLGVHYLVNGTQNISNGRNLVLERAIEIADLAVMTDDDCMPELQWIDALVRTFDANDADSVTGPMLVDLPDGAPAWLREESLFEKLDSFPTTDGEMHEGHTNNCLLSCDWLRRHPDHRFSPALGKLGGEDMVFFRGAIRIGLRSWYSAAARVHSVEPMDELSFRALLRIYFWLGNSESVTNLTLGEASRRRLFLRGLRRVAIAAQGPLRRAVRGRSPQLRSASVLAARGLGMASGAVGLRVAHH